jgi:hypothetical protein
VFRNVPRAGFAVEPDRLGYASTRITSVSGRTPSCAIASAAGCVSIAAMTASMSATSITNPTRVGFSGSTDVRMLVTPRGPKNSSRFGEASRDPCPLRRGRPSQWASNLLMFERHGRSGARTICLALVRWHISVSVAGAQARRRLHEPACLRPNQELSACGASRSPARGSRAPSYLAAAGSARSGSRRRPARRRRRRSQAESARRPTR